MRQTTSDERKSALQEISYQFSMAAKICIPPLVPKCVWCSIQAISLSCHCRERPIADLDATSV